MKTICFFFLNLSIYTVLGEILATIPPHLLPCYRNGGPYLAAPRRLDIFISLLRKLELKTNMDMRMFSTALLRSLRLDGITEAANIVETDFVLPYRGSAFQFHKYKILMDIFLPSQDLIDPDEYLTLEEKCLLHKMISSTVQPWERGDESTVCPLSIEQRQSMVTQGSKRLTSRCPIEDGVIQTRWGPIAPGTMIAAMASSLEAQRVLVTDVLRTNVLKEEVPTELLNMALNEWDSTLETMNDIDDNITHSANSQADISNVWAATLAGDLAEVVVNQGPLFGAAPQRMVIGSNNRWNDTYIPRAFYLLMQNNSSNNWHITDAEILAGIDGLILAKYLPSWVEQRRTLRLTQVIEMYYSEWGVSFDRKVRACNRHALFADIVDRAQLSMETSRLAHILSLQQISVYIPLEEMNRIAVAAVSAFMDYAPTLLKQYHVECTENEQSLPAIDLVIATDSTWKGYQVEQFVSWIGGAFEIGLQKSSISLLHGNTGEWIVPKSRDLTSVFTTLGNYTEEWPNRLNLPNVMSAVIQHVRNETLQDISDMISAGPSTVVLIISPTDRMSTDELESTRSLMYSLRTSFFDVYFAYASLDTSDFKNINNEYMDYSELFITVPSTSIADVTSAVSAHLVRSVVPSRITGAQCSYNGTDYIQIPYEDYVLPGREQMYRIHPFYLRQQSRVHVEFRNDGQGRILVCMWRGAETSHLCHSINERDTFVFNLTKPCPSANFCPPTNFLVTAQTTLNLCAHNDCRMPHQVGYYVQHSGLRCLPLLGSSARTAPATELLSLLISILYCFNKTLF